MSTDTALSEYIRRIDFNCSTMLKELKISEGEKSYNELEELILDKLKKVFSKIK